MKVALLQLCASDDKAKNIAQAHAMCKEALAQKASFVLLPEVFNFRGDLREGQVLARASENIPGPSTKAFAALAQEHKASILLGSIIEKTVSNRAYNTSVLISPLGKVAAKYRKIHLFDARLGDKIVREAECFISGRAGKRVKLGEFRAGLSICYDLRFPKMYQQYAAQGVEILTLPSCFTKKTGEAHWETLLRARAIENLSYVLAPNQVGTDARGMEAYGHSMIISPWGKIIARGSGEAQEIIYGDIDMEEVRKARQILPGIIK
jgi:predicted amidohydrolase